MKIRRCPQCRSSDIMLDSTGGQSGKFECKKCGYLGVLILEEDIDVKDFEKK